MIVDKKLNSYILFNLLIFLMIIINYGRLINYNGFYYIFLLFSLLLLIFSKVNFYTKNIFKKSLNINLILLFVFIEGVFCIGNKDFYKDISLVLCLFAPLTLVNIGYILSNNINTSNIRILLILDFFILLYFFNENNTANYSLLLISLFAGIFSFSLLFINSNYIKYISFVIIYFGGFSTENGSRSILFLGLILLFISILNKSKSNYSNYFYGLLIGSSILYTAYLFVPDLLIWGKIGAGVNELMPSDFGGDNFGGASNLRGYEGLLFIEKFESASLLNYIFGFGPDATISLDRLVSDASDNTEYTILHNGFLTIFLKFGIIGFLIILFSYFYIFILFKKRLGKVAYLISICMIFLTFVGGGTFVSVWLEFYIFLGYTLGANKINQYNDQI